MEHSTNSQPSQSTKIDIPLKSSEMQSLTISRTTESILAERGPAHGPFFDNARIAQKLKMVVRNEAGWNDMTHIQHEAIEMILHKIARAIAGKHDYADHWDDIAGYAKLVSKECK